MTAQRYTVLVVDDEPHITHVVGLKLRRAGFDVVEASDGEEALELAAATPPDLVITDLQMPFLSGVDLCRALRGNPAMAAIPIVMLTARGYAYSGEALKDAGADEIIYKPFSPSELVRLVVRLLGADPTVAGVAA